MSLLTITDCFYTALTTQFAIRKQRQQDPHNLLFLHITFRFFHLTVGLHLSHAHLAGGEGKDAKGLFVVFLRSS